MNNVGAYDQHPSSLNDKSSGSSNPKLKEIEDKIDCLQRSQVYLHRHIDKLEYSIREEICELRNQLFYRLTDLRTLLLANG
jgi:hypothetical protein